MLGRWPASGSVEFEGCIFKVSVVETLEYLLFSLKTPPKRNSTNGIAQIGMEMKPKVKRAHLGVTPVKNCKMTSGSQAAKRRRPEAAAVRAESVPAGG